MSLDCSKSRTYNYRFPHEKIIICIFLLSIFFVWFSIKEFKQPIKIGEGKIFDLFFAILYSIFLGIGLFVYFNKKREISKKIVLNDDSIEALGFKENCKTVETISMKFSEIKSCDLTINEYSHVKLIVKSANSKIELIKGQISNNEFIDVVNTLASNSKLENFEKSPEEIKFQFLSTYNKLTYNKDTVFLLGLWVYFLCLVFSLIKLEKYLSMQIDEGLIGVAGIILNTMVLYFIVPRIFRSNILFSERLKKPLMAFFVVFLFMIGSVSFGSLIAFVNQSLDSSSEKIKESFLIKESQDKDDIEYNGICFQVAHFDPNRSSFGANQLCQKRVPNLKEGKRVLVYYKEGLFSNRWATKIILK
jgi:hypothetical protein